MIEENLIKNTYGYNSRVVGTEFGSDTSRGSMIANAFSFFPFVFTRSLLFMLGNKGSRGNLNESSYNMRVKLVRDSTEVANSVFRQN